LNIERSTLNIGGESLKPAVPLADQGFAGAFFKISAYIWPFAVAAHGFWPADRESTAANRQMLAAGRESSADIHRLYAEDCRLLAEEPRLLAEDCRLWDEERRLLADGWEVSVENRRLAAATCRSATEKRRLAAANRQSATEKRQSPMLCLPSFSWFACLPVLGFYPPHKLSDRLILK
jgi:hypothetical protein